MYFFINRAQFVRETNKEIDGNNFLVAYDVPIAKTGIQQYTREELGDRNGPASEFVNVYRDPSVFENDELVQSFDGIPVVYCHPDNGRVDNLNFKDYVVGTVSGVYFRNGSLYAKKITIIDKQAIEDVLNKFTNELSIGFRGNVIREFGQHDGISYEYKENVIHANHLALCEKGKAGPFYAINSIKKGKNMARRSMTNSEEGGYKMKDCMDGVPEINVEGHVKQVVREKMSKVHPKNFGDEHCEHMEDASEDEKLEHIEEKEKVAKKHLEKEHMMGDESDPDMIEADNIDRNLANQLKKANLKLKDLIKVKNKEIRELELKNSQLDEALVEAQEYMRKMASQIRSSKLGSAMAGPDSAANPFSPRHKDMCNGITTSFLFK